MTHRLPVTVSLPFGLVAAIDRAAETQMRTRSSLVEVALTDFITDRLRLPAERPGSETLPRPAGGVVMSTAGGETLEGYSKNA